MLNVKPPAGIAARIVLAGTAGADHAMLRPAAAFDLQIRKRIPIGFDLAEASDALGQQFFKRNGLQIVGNRMLDRGHRLLLV